MKVAYHEESYLMVRSFGYTYASNLTASMDGMNMSVLKRWKSTGLPSKGKALTNLSVRMDETLFKVKVLASRILSPPEVEMECLKDEVWVDLSRIYYKYEDKVQKQAFHEVVREMSEKIIEGNWESVYKKLYRIEQGSI